MKLNDHAEEYGILGEGLRAFRAFLDRTAAYRGPVPPPAAPNSPRINTARLEFTIEKPRRPPTRLPRIAE
jgi:hypothetical protein